MSIRLIGWLIILVASVKIMLPFILPITIDDAIIERIVGRYFQPVSIGSAHIVLNEGRLALLLQQVDTPADAHQGVHVRRAFVSPSPIRSLLAQKWVFNKIKLYNGELNVGFGPEHIRLGAVKIPVHPNQPLPIWVHHLNLKNIKVHVDEIDEISDLYIHEVHIMHPKRKGQLKAWITEDQSKRASVKVLFDFEKQYNDIRGDLYVKGYDHKLIRLFNLIKWPGAAVEGKADFEFWAKVQNGQVNSAVLDLKGEDLVLRKPDGILNVNGMEGRLSYEWANKQHHWNGQGLSLKVDEIPRDTKFTISSSDLNKYTLTGKDFDIELIHFIVSDIPKVETFFQSFDLMPTGNIPYVKMTFDGQDIKPTSVLMRAENLSFKQKDLNIKGLDGDLHYQPGVIITELSGQALNVVYPSVFKDAFNLDNYTLKAHYDLNRSLISLQAQAAYEDKPLEGTMDLLWQPDPLIDFNIRAPSLAVNQVKALLPIHKMKPNLVQWLDKSLLRGDFSNIDFSYFGKISDFVKPDNPNPFSFHSGLKNIHLDYADVWPDLTALNGEIKIHQHALEVKGSGQFEQAHIKHVTASIQDMRAQPSVLHVNTEIDSDLSYGWDVMHAAHLVNQDVYEGLQLKAPMDLSLQLGIELVQKGKTKVDGKVSFENAFMAAVATPFKLEELKGEIHFNEQGVFSKGFAGKLNGHALTSELKIDFNQHKKLEWTAEGVVMGEQVSQWTQGMAPFHLKLDWPFDNYRPTLVGDLNLDQVSIDLPEPFYKPKGEEQNLSFIAEKSGETNLTLKAQTTDVDLNFGLSKVRGHLEPAWGVLTLGEQNTYDEEPEGFSIRANLPKVELDEWIHLYQALPHKEVPLYDLKFDLKMVDFVTQPTYLKHVHLTGDYLAQTQQLNLDVVSPKLKGKFNLNMAENGPWVAHIDHLFLEKKPITAPKNHIDLPRRPITLKIGEFENATASVRDFGLQLIPNEEGFVINDFSFKTKRSNVDISGVWSNQAEPNLVKLAGKIETADFQDLPNNFGKTTSLREAKGKILFDVAYKGHLFEPDLSSIRGQGELNLKKGYIHGINPGFGRILSLLNVDTIQRRLRLDFSDVTKRGFSFDTLEGRFLLGHGRIKTDKLRLEAPTANIEFYGDMALVSQQVRAEVTVMPNVTGSLPLAAAIAAGNPAVGAAVWLMDKVLGRKIQEMTRYNYLVSGTLDSPQIKEMVDINQSHIGKR